MMGRRTDYETLALQRAILRHACLYCGAAPKEPCVTVGGDAPGRAVEYHHQARVHLGADDWRREQAVSKKDAVVAAVEDEVAALILRVDKARRLRTLRERLATVLAELDDLGTDDLTPEAQLTALRVDVERLRDKVEQMEKT